MRKYDRLFIPFVFFLIISFLILLIFKTPVGGLVGGIVEDVFHPAQGAIVRGFTFGRSGGYDMETLVAENADLTEKLKKMQELQKENQALQDQYQTPNLPTQNLLPAHIVGLEPFLPSVASPDYIVLDRGRGDNVKVGTVAVSKNYLVGTVVSVSQNASKVRLVTAKDATFTAKTSKTNANGVMQGLGNGEMVLANVVLSDSLEKNDLVVTASGTDANGNGVPPDLSFGKIQSIDKKASNLFQSAEIVSPIDVTKLRELFLITK